MAVFSAAVALDLAHVSESPGGLLKIQITGSTCLVWDAAGPGRAQQSIHLQSSQVMLMLPVEDHSLRITALKTLLSVVPLSLHVMDTQHAPPLSFTKALESCHQFTEEETEAQKC